ncbi:MAG: alpha-ketoglutarate-dependent dioxygenase AlkB [Saprospiraceae bacterium]|nr:alpha-ketoglutarate-dependent dioxygenase AlkB [Saprospiraceae bacterium]
METNLVNTSLSNEVNLLPTDGIVNYYGTIFTVDESVEIFYTLISTIQWKHDEAIIFGRHIITKRKVAWYADASMDYKYSNTTRKAIRWTDFLFKLKTKIEKLTKETYNSCLLNLYHDGNEGMAWHSDDEKELKKEGCIASLSFGAERRFLLKHRNTKEKIAVFLENGSLLVMKGSTQSHWLHSIPKSKKIQHGRINLTFRQMNDH